MGDGVCGRRFGRVGRMARQSSCRIRGDVGDAEGRNGHPTARPVDTVVSGPPSPTGAARRRIAFGRCRRHGNFRPHDVGTLENAFRHSRARSRSTRRLFTTLGARTMRHRTWKLCEPGMSRDASRREVARSMNTGGGFSDGWTTLRYSFSSSIGALCGADMALKTGRPAGPLVDQKDRARDGHGTPDPETGSVRARVKRMAAL